MPDINNNGQGNPMNGGYNGGNNPTDILSTITQTLTQSLGSVERQLQNISTQLINLNGQTTQANRNSQNFIRNFTGNRRSRGMAYQEKTLNNLYSELKKLRNDTKVSTIGNGYGKGIDGAIASGFNKIQKKYQESLNKIQQKLQTDSNIQQLQQLVTRTAQGLERVRQQKTQAEQSGNTTEVHRLEQIIQSRENALTQQQQNLDSQMARYTQQMEDAYEENSRAVQALQQSYEALNEVNSKLSGAYSDLSSISPAFANFIENQDKLSKKDQYKEAVNKAIEVVTESITQLEEKIASLSDEDSEQKEILEKQLKNANEQKDYLKNLKPIKDNTRQMWTSLKDVGGAVIKGALTGLKNSLENRYLDTYAEGFQRVYDSVESTRNEISARLRFNQGQFDDMQNNIQAEIKAQGLEGAISLVDVNEAVQGLVAAGITDQETIEKLAFEQAKLKYMGSPFDLQNEGNLSYIMSEINKGTDIDTIVQGFETLSATARTLGEEYGNTMALANGGAQTTLSQIFSMGEAAGKSYEQIISDAQDAMISQMSLASYNVSSDLLTSMLKEIQEQNISSTSPFNQYLLQQGLSADTMRYLSVGEQQDKLVRALQEATDQGGEVPNWLKPLMETWGIGAQYTDIANFLQGAKSQKGIQTSNTPQQQKEIEKLQKEDQEAMQKALYKSQTEKVNTEYENKMTDLAQNAEHFFEGDTIFMSQINNIKNGIDSIIDILATFAWSSITGGARGLFGGGGAGGAGGTGGAGGSLLSATNVKDFMTGSGGTTAGALGKAAGIAYGAYNFGSALASNVQRNDDGSINYLQTTVETLSDKQALEGIMEGVGGAVAGPIGSAVGKLSVDLGTAVDQFFGISKGLVEWDPLGLAGEDDGFNSLLNSFQEAADKLGEAANAQLDSAQTSLNDFKTMNADQKKNILLQQARQGELLDEQSNKIELETINAMNEEDINKLFANTVEKQYKLQEEQAKADIEKANMQAAIATQRATVASDIKKYADKGWAFDTEYGGDTSEATQKMLGRNIKNYEHLASEMSSDTRAQIFSSYKTAKGMGKNIDAYLAEYFPDASESEKNYYRNLLMVYDTNKEKYDKSMEEFHGYWKDAEEASENKDTVAVWLKYQEMRGLDKDYSGIEMGAYGVPEIDPETNMPFLRKGYADLLQPEAYEGKFKSGLTRVPSNNYTAVLHEGERILTKREAEVYNNIIPDIVEAATTEQYFRTDRSSSNVMNTNVYGSSDSELHKDITDQTSSLTDVLNKILEALRSIMVTSSVKSGINRNILAMNSDVVQVNTSR